MNNSMSPKILVDHIEFANKHIASFWSNSYGWAPDKAAKLLNKSRLDWQISLSSSLRLWIREPPNALSDGELILAWTNLGALVEGTLKLFLCVYYEDFQNDDVENFLFANTYDKNKKSPKPPNGLALDKIAKYIGKINVLDRLSGSTNIDLVKRVQTRRNAVHAFQHREIGDAEEFWQSTKQYLDLLHVVDGLLPYPDDWPALASR